MSDGDRDEINSEGSDYNYEEEVNLDEFNFDDSIMEWKLPPTPQLPPRFL